MRRRRARRGRAATRRSRFPASVRHRGANPAAAAAPRPSSSPGALSLEQTQLAVTGARKAKVLYDYDAHDASELSLLADEVCWRPPVPRLPLAFCSGVLVSLSWRPDGVLIVLMAFCPSSSSPSTLYQGWILIG